MGLFSWLTSTILPKLLNNSIFGRSYYISRLCKQNTDIPWGTVVAFPCTNSAFNWHFVLNLHIATGNQFNYSASRTVSADCWNRHKPRQFLDSQNEKMLANPKGLWTCINQLTFHTSLAQLQLHFKRVQVNVILSHWHHLKTLVAQGISLCLRL